MKKKSILKKWWFWVIVVVVVGLIGSQGDKEETKETVSNTAEKTELTDTVKEEPKAEEKEEPKEEAAPTPGIVVNAADVIKTFEDNEIKGKQTYTDKLAEITGIVNDVGEILGQTYVTIGSGEDFELVSLQCFFKDESEIAKLAEVSKGDTITIIGTIGEQSLNIEVSDCKFK